MKRFITAMFVFGLVLMPLSGVFAKGKEFSLPANAKQVSENVYSLGFALDQKTDTLVEGFAIVHKKEQKARTTATNSKAGRLQCFGFLAQGAKWKSAEPWLFNPANTSGLVEATLFSNLSFDISKWEDAADGSLNGIMKNILGDGTQTSNSLSVDSNSPDDQNEVYFGSITDSNAIAVTTVWGVFGGPAKNRVLVEWDMVFDEADYDWSQSGEAGKMDFENIATHELGHAVGLADLYNSGCIDETMYGYADLGQTNKQSLNGGDITGIKQLYQ